MGKCIKWTMEEREYLESIALGRTYKQIAELMNLRFERTFTEEMIKGATGRYHLITGTAADTRFKKGRIPENKGKKGTCAEGCKKSWFKKGHTPANYKPVGSERVDVDGYVLVKTAEPRTWKLKHRLIYEAAYGPIPENHIVVFADGNKLNLSLDNLMLISLQENAVMNHNKLRTNNIEATKAGKNLADLMIKVSSVEKAHKKRRRKNA